jgi:hypothetical protein
LASPAERSGWILVIRGSKTYLAEQKGIKDIFNKESRENTQKREDILI